VVSQVSKSRPGTPCDRGSSEMSTGVDARTTTGLPPQRIHVIRWGPRGWSAALLEETGATAAAGTVVAKSQAVGLMTELGQAAALRWALPE
jgi:hypothetical protein